MSDNDYPVIDTDGFTYQFPATKWSTATAGVATLLPQIAKVRSEVDEAKLAVMTHDATYHDIAVELMDVIVASETALRMLESAGTDMDAAKAELLRKNGARGYFPAEVTP